MYKHRVPSTTSLSDVEDDDCNLLSYVDNDNRALVVSPAQWSSRARLAPYNRRPPHKFSPIARLPPEIIIHIFKHLYSSRDLYSCLRVSRTWCECSVELLWHKPAFSKFETLEKLSRLLMSPDQTFTYASFIRRLNFLALSKDIKDEILYVLAKCDRLERLTLINCNRITANSLASVLPNFPNLVAVDLTGVVNTTNAAIVGLASAAKRLQGINLAGCKQVSDEGILALAQNCPLLRRVKLSDLALLTDEPISALAKLCPLLLEIDLNHCELITDIAIRDIWLNSTHMREMRLSYCVELTDAAFPAPIKKEQSVQPEGPNPFPSSTNPNPDELPPLVLNRAFEHLRMLDLTACAQVTDDAIEGIISHAPKVRNLVLSKCALLTDRAVEAICSLGRHLHYLHLGHAAKITDRSVRTLARSCTRLRYIDFANCVLLTDMSVFELASLPKLRRVGLVRVNNLTDEAIYALADRHATLERIHLSYCDQISVMAIHFLLQKLHKLTHLSLTGVPAFRQSELQQFCREPPNDFNPSQQLAFCVYSGKGVSQLRAFLTELFDHITEMNGTDDTEYEDDDDDTFHEDTPEPELEPTEDLEERYTNGPRRFIDIPNITAHRGGRHVFPEQETVPARHNHHYPISATRSTELQSTAANLQGAANRLNAQILASANQPSSSTSSRRSRAHASSSRQLADILPIVESSHSPPPSDAASNVSGASSGGAFFRNYPDSTVPVRNGTMTPDLNFAEIGHGRGGQSIPASLNHQLRRGQELVPQQRSSYVEVESPPRRKAAAGSSSAVSTSLDTPAFSRPFTNPLRAHEVAVPWPYREPDSPGTSSGPSAGPEVHELPGASDSGRGRTAKRSLRNTLNAASSFFGRSPTRGTHDEHSSNREH